MPGATGWLLDTNVISELRKGAKAAGGVRSWAARTNQAEFYLGSLTLVELRLGIDRLADQIFRTELQIWLDAVRHGFTSRILAVSEDVLFAWRRLSIDGQKAGYTYSHPDSMLGATALVHGLGVATRNTKDFQRVGVPLVNPWLTPTL